MLSSYAHATKDTYCNSCTSQQKSRTESALTYAWNNLQVGYYAAGVIVTLDEAQHFVERHSIDAVAFIAALRYQTKDTIQIAVNAAKLWENSDNASIRIHNWFIQQEARQELFMKVRAYFLFRNPEFRRREARTIANVTHPELKEGYHMILREGIGRADIDVRRGWE